MHRLFAAALLLAAVSSARAAERPPNVVWIFGEDMGPELGCYGDPNAVTPNMDRLAKRMLNDYLYARAVVGSEFVAPLIEHEAR